MKDPFLFFHASQGNGHNLIQSKDKSAHQYNFIRLTGTLNRQKFRQAVEHALEIFDESQPLPDNNLVDDNAIASIENQHPAMTEIDFSAGKDEGDAALRWMKQYDNNTVLPGKVKLEAATFLLTINQLEYWFYIPFNTNPIGGYPFQLFINFLAKKYIALTEENSTKPNTALYRDEFIAATRYHHSPGYLRDATYWNNRIAPIPDKLFSKKYNIEKQPAANRETYLVKLTGYEQSTIKNLITVSGKSLEELTLAALFIYFGKTSPESTFIVEMPAKLSTDKAFMDTVDLCGISLPFKGHYHSETKLVEMLSEISNTHKEDGLHKYYPVQTLTNDLNKNVGEENLYQVSIQDSSNNQLYFGRNITAVINSFIEKKKLRPLQLLWCINEATKELQLQFTFLPAYFTQTEIKFLAGRLIFILSQFADRLDKRVDDISIVPPAERLLLQSFQHSKCDYPRHKTMVDLFEEQVVRNPNATAVVFEDKILTYTQLNERANQLARYLQQHAITTGSLVLICMERSAEMLVAMMAILKAGAAYVPVDPAFPEDRISFVLQDTKAAIILVDKDHLTVIPANEQYEIVNINDHPKIKNQPLRNLKNQVLPGDLAYVIYTSGSTGRPKGVMIEHKALMDHCFGVIESAHLTSCKSFALFSPLVFDAGHSIIHSSFILGATLHVLSTEILANGEALEGYIKSNKVDCIKIVPSLWLSYASDNYKILPGKVMILGGEEFSISVLEKLIQYQYEGEVYNHYGPTEATIGKTIHPIDFNQSYTTVPIGKPFSNTSIYIVDAAGDLVPIGVPGEMMIAGEGLARAYLNQPELTSAKFINDPFNKAEGNKMYKTGDLTKWLPDGNIAYLGRIDEQLKIRGYRIEPGEIEAVLKESGLVKQAILTGVDNRDNSRRLVAYIIPDKNFSVAAIRLYLQSKLPDYMIPVQWILMEHFPLTINGKIDRKGLPDAGEAAKQTRKLPSNDLEQKLADTWCKFLRIGEVSTDDNFFELGGQSLTAMRIIAAIFKDFNTVVTIKDLFQFSTIESLAVHIQAQEITNLSTVIEAAVKPAFIPLSFNQQGLWFIDQFNGSRQYHLPFLLNLNGAVNSNDLTLAFKQLITRHDILRTVIRNNKGEGYQVLRNANEWHLDIINARHLNKDEAGIDQLIGRLIDIPFSLTDDFMLRATLIYISDNEQILVVILHHIASDGWSTSILMKELSELYNAKLEDRKFLLSKLSIQYADFAIWQRNNFSTDLITKKITYWQTKLAGIVPLQLPIDKSRPAVQQTNGNRFTFQIDQPLTKGIKKLAQQETSTLFMNLLAAFNVMLYRYTGQTDICVGTPVAGRQQQEQEGLIGYFVNTLPLRSTINPNAAYKDLLRQVKETTLDAFENQQVPFYKLVEMIVKERDSSMSPLFQVMFVLQNSPEFDELKLNNLTVSKREQRTAITSKFDLSFVCTETSLGLEISIEYCTAIFNATTIERMAGHYKNMLQSAIDKPATAIGKLIMLATGEEQQLLYEFNNAYKDVNNGDSIVTLFEQQVLATPNNIAVTFGNSSVTYNELDNRSNQFAALLQSKGVVANTLVPICLERSIYMIVGIMGILKSGGAYVPVDPEYPAKHIEYILEDTDAKMVVCSSKTSAQFAMLNKLEIIEIDGDWLSNESAQNGLQKLIAVDQLAYVIYTSGSTGTPKGVLIEHKGLAASTIARNEYYHNMNAVLLIPSFAFDSSVAVIFGALTTGAKLMLCSSEHIKEPNIVKQLLQETQTILCVPSYYRFLLEAGLIKASALSTVILAGEKLDQQLVAAHYAYTKNVELYNEYGPTEGSVWSTVSEIKTSDDLVTIGKPVQGVKVYITDKNLQLVPVGVAGELCIGGAQVARGYQHLPELTNEKFLINPFEKDSAEKMYKTGDLAKWLPDGNIAYLGRIDDQVKIHGYRIETGGIEKVLQECDGISQAVIIAKEFETGSKKLVAYIVTESRFDKALYQSFLASKLPEYMIPSLWVEMESFPLTANGKINKKALPDPDKNQLSLAAFVSPVTELQLALSLHWQQLLNISPIGINDNFFSLGGHSLMAMRLSSLIEQQQHIAIKVKSLFEYPTIAGLANFLEQQKVQSSFSGVTVQPKPDRIPLSFSQQSLSFIDQLQGSLQYHIPTVLRLKGNVDKNALQFAFNTIICRHEVLRTTIQQVDGTGYQQINELTDFNLSVIIGAEFIGDEIKLQECITGLIDIPFNLAKDYMLRADLIIISNTENVLVITQHHIASDGWSTSILINELVETYNAQIEKRGSSLKPLPLQFADYANWQHNQVQTNEWRNKLAYWQQQLDGISNLNLPVDYIRPLIQATDGAVANYVIDSILYQQLQQLSKQQGTTLFMTLLAAFNVLMHRYTGQQDICIGTPVAGRRQEELEGLIGFFMNTIVVRTTTDGDMSFKDLLQQVKQTTLAAYDNQDVPFDKVVETVLSERDMSRNPLFQVMFALQNTPAVKDADFTGLEVNWQGRHQSGHNTSKFDLTFNLTETSNGIDVSIEYCTALFNATTISKLADHFTSLLQTIVEMPGESIGKLQMLKQTEVLHLLKNFTNTEQQFTGKSVVALFEEQVVKNPSAVAVEFNGIELTYIDLNERANQLAHYLIAQGVGAEMIIPVCMHRGLNLIAAMLGILKAGAAYAPIDPAYPVERIAYMLKDISPVIFISEKYTLEQWPDAGSIEFIDFENGQSFLKDYSTTNPAVIISPEQLAYVIYTSGSTGKPKGVMVEHAGLSNLVQWHTVEFNVSNISIASAMAGVGFDAFGWEIWPYLSSGATLHLLDDATRLDLPQLISLFEGFNITHSFIATALVPEFIQASFGKNLALKYLLTGGDKLNAVNTKKLSYTLVNNYGPTETTVVATQYLINNLSEQQVPSIGKPIANTVIYLLNEQQQLVPAGVAGEVYIGGAGVARGYLNLPEMTSEKFVNNFVDLSAGKRLYRSGDLARWSPDGNLEYLGRVDQQVKIRGFRIELGEIEHALVETASIKQAMVLARKDGSGNNQLVAYFIADENYVQAKTLSEIKQRLPEYMVPAFWVKLDRFPLTKNGKIDIAALPVADIDITDAPSYTPPQTTLQLQLETLWNQLLGREQTSIHSNFFTLGGHSLIAMRLVSSIRKKLETDISVNDVFIYPTIATLSEFLAAKENVSSLSTSNIQCLVPIKKGRAGIPLYIVAGGGGTALRFKPFVELLDPGQPVYALQPPVEHEKLMNFPTTIEKIAEKFINEICVSNPKGPYALAGHCLGGIIAFEMSKQLKAKGKKVQMLAMFDSVLKNPETNQHVKVANFKRAKNYLKKTFSKFVLKWDFESYLLTNHTKQAFRYKMHSFTSFIVNLKNRLKGEVETANDQLKAFNKSAEIYKIAAHNYHLSRQDISIILFYARERYYFTDISNDIRFKRIDVDDATKKIWCKYANDVTIHEIDGDHSSIFEVEKGRRFAVLLQRYLKHRNINKKVAKGLCNSLALMFQLDCMGLVDIFPAIL
ncbi:hypothetical protein BH11BAC3_BH11BAC3_00550 [soil metagenome]